MTHTFYHYSFSFTIRCSFFSLPVILYILLCGLSVVYFFSSVISQYFMQVHEIMVLCISAKIVRGILINNSTPHVMWIWLKSMNKNLTASDPFTGKIQLTNSDLLAFNTNLPTCCILINVIVGQYLNIVNTPCEVLVMCATGSLVAPSKQRKKSQ